MPRFKITVILLALLLSACTEGSRHAMELSKTQAESAIVGGTEVLESDLTSNAVVMIYGEKEDLGAYICSGTFIAPQVVLTAAHCVVDNVQAMSLFFGVQPFAKSPTTLKITGIKRHEDFQGGVIEERNDLALIFFEGALPAGATLAPINQNPDFLPTRLQALGYGRTEGLENSENASEQLGILRSVTIDGSGLSFYGVEILEIDQTNGRGVCFGDSGGPLFSATGELMGVAAGVVGDLESEDSCRYRSYFTNVGAYRDWIIKNTTRL